MNLSSFKCISCFGIGGGGLYYIARFLLILGRKVEGFDIKLTDRVTELQGMGAVVSLRNPEPEDITENIDTIIYSEALPKQILEIVEGFKSTKNVIEVGEFLRNLTKMYENRRLNKDEEEAFIKSDIAPLYRVDTSKMRYIGVTGTDGKTTTCTMIYHILKEMGYNPALISTVSAKIGDKELDTGFHTTTPSSQDIYKLIKLMEEEGCTHAILETTSQGLAMGRVAGLKFDVVAYTNITNEHLDYHKTWEGIFEAKSRLITEHLKDGGVAVLNKDDIRSYEKLSKLAEKFLSYSRLESADLQATNLKSAENRIEFKLNEHIPVSISIFGEYNVSNSLAALGVIKGLGLNLEEAVKKLTTFNAVTGRMQFLCREPYKFIVDFAHTPNALEQALSSVCKLKENGSRLIVVFGCPGKRDTYKRAEMGKVAKKYADIVILTADDPRTESLKAINNQIEEGFNQAESLSGVPVELIRFDYDDKDVDVRRNAIRKAIELAKPKDIVIICGKAHEQSLCFGTTEYKWNDIEEAERLLKQYKL